MAGFPLMAIGAGIGEGAEAIRKQRQTQIEEALRALQIKQYQDERAAGKDTFAAALAGAFGGAQMSPLGTGGLGLPQMGGVGGGVGGGGGIPSARPPLPPGVGGAIRSAGDEWLNQNAPFPTLGRPNPPVSTTTDKVPGPEAYALARGPGAPSLPGQGSGSGFSRDASGSPRMGGAPPDTYIGGTTPAWEGAPRTQSGGGVGDGLAAGGALTGRGPPVGSPENERLTNLVIGDESGGRNIEQQIVPRSKSSASGIGQMIDSTWREVAPKVGAGQYPRAISAPTELQRKAVSQRIADRGLQDWAPYNSTLARHLGIGGGGGDPVQQEADGTTIRAAGMIPQEVYGRMSVQAMAQAIEKANPGADPYVKMLALERGMKLVSPYEQRAWEFFKLQHQDMWKERELRETARAHDISERRANALEESRGWDILTDPTNQQQYRYNKISKEATTLTGEPYKPGGASRLGGPNAAPNPQSVDYVAKKIASYDMAPMSGWSLRSKFGQDVMAKVAELNPEYDQTKYQAKVRGQVAFTTGRQGDAVRAFSVAIDHLATLEDVAQALAQNDTQRLNQLQNVISKEFGYAGVPDFALVKTIVGSEISKATIGGVGALKDREELRDALNAANSPEQLMAVAQQAKRLMAGQLGGFRRQAGSAGFSQRDFEGALSPRAKAELESLPGGAPDNAPGATRPIKPGRSAAPAAGAPPEAVEYLRQNDTPEMRQAFDQKYGAGAATKALGQ